MFPWVYDLSGIDEESQACFYHLVVQMVAMTHLEVCPRTENWGPVHKIHRLIPPSEETWLFTVVTFLVKTIFSCLLSTFCFLTFVFWQGLQQ